MGLLPGVTRKVVLELARKMDIECRETDILPDELLTADEVLADNSMIEIMPDPRDGKIIGHGRPGEVTQKLAAASHAQVILETG